MYFSVFQVMKKYKSSVAQLSTDQITLNEQISECSRLEMEKQQLKEQLAEVTAKLENLEGESEQTNIYSQRRLDMKIKELESKLELEQTTKQRLEVMLTYTNVLMKKTNL